MEFSEIKGTPSLALKFRDGLLEKGKEKGKKDCEPHQLNPRHSRVHDGEFTLEKFISERSQQLGRMIFAERSGIRDFENPVSWPENTRERKRERESDARATE